MSFAKIHHQDDQDALFKACGGVLNQLLDRDAFIKSAASDVISKELITEFTPPKDHYGVHCIIMGDSETYGQNRNGDYWPKKACVTYHPTFVSNGAYFREHNHRSKDLAIGQIKYAAYNPKMARTELILWGNIKKAEDIYESLRDGKQRSYSMSARVPYDVCNICDNKARFPANYCKHAKLQMNQWVPEATKYAYVINDHPTFFDASDVAFPADRTAHYLEYRFPTDTEFKKSASAGNVVISGAEWAKFANVNLPEENNPLQLNAFEQSVLNRLAQHEEFMDTLHSGQPVADNSKVAFVKEVGEKVITDELSDSELRQVRAIRPDTFFGELAKRACILPFKSFLAYALNKSHQEVEENYPVKTACSMLPMIFRKLMSGESGGCGCGGADMDLFRGGSPGVISLDSNYSDPIEKIMDVATDKFSLATAPVKRRVIRITVIKAASELPKLKVADATVFNNNPETNSAKFLAGLYGLYKLAAICDMHKLSRENIGEAQELLAVAHNNFASY